MCWWTYRPWEFRDLERSMVCTHTNWEEINSIKILVLYLSSQKCSWKNKGTMVNSKLEKESDSARNHLVSIAPKENLGLTLKKCHSITFQISPVSNCYHMSHSQHLKSISKEKFTDKLKLTKIYLNISTNRLKHQLEASLKKLISLSILRNFEGKIFKLYINHSH